MAELAGLTLILCLIGNANREDEQRNVEVVRMASVEDGSRDLLSGAWCGVRCVGLAVAGFRDQTLTMRRDVAMW